MSKNGYLVKIILKKSWKKKVKKIEAKYSINGLYLVHGIYLIHGLYLIHVIYAIHGIYF